MELNLGWFTPLHEAIPELAATFGSDDSIPCEDSGKGRVLHLVHEKGLEPSLPLGNRNLNPARLPIPPLVRAGRSLASMRWVVQPPPASGGDQREQLANGARQRFDRSEREAAESHEGPRQQLEPGEQGEGRGEVDQHEEQGAGGRCHHVGCEPSPGAGSASARQRQQREAADHQEGDHSHGLRIACDLLPPRLHHRRTWARAATRRGLFDPLQRQAEQEARDQDHAQPRRITVQVA